MANRIPRGYAKKEGDARKFHPSLLGPVNLQELEIDPKNGMKVISDQKIISSQQKTLLMTYIAEIHGDRRPILGHFDCTYQALAPGLHQTRAQRARDAVVISFW